MGVYWHSIMLFCLPLGQGLITCWCNCIANLLEWVVHLRNDFVAVPDSVRNEVNLSVWLNEEAVNHPKLKQLAMSLPSILVQDRAPKTVSSYVRAYQAWRKWATQCSATALPADPSIFALYLVNLIQQGSSVSTLNSAIYGASWVHKKSGYRELSDSSIVQQVAEAGRRILAKPPTRKKALEVNQVKKIIVRSI